MIVQGVRPSVQVCIGLLRECRGSKALAAGRRTHALLVSLGVPPSVMLGVALLDMYAGCGDVGSAHRLLNGVRMRHVPSSWNKVILAHAKHGQEEQALTLFERMRMEGVTPNIVTFLAALKACAGLTSLTWGRALHESIKKSGLQTDAFVGSSLIDMYSKCGSLADARQVFNQSPCRSVVAWNAMISGYAQYGHTTNALSLLYQMLDQGVEPDRITYISIFKACANLESLDHGKRIHESMKTNRLASDYRIKNILVDMYAKCGSIVDARQVFDSMHKRDIVSWNALISGYAQHGHGKEALALFKQMQREDVMADGFTYVSVLKACIGLGCVETGKEIHAQVRNNGFEGDLFVGNTLIDMYTKCDSIKDARQIFDGMPVRDVVTWTAMISGYAQHGYCNEALALFKQMQQEGQKPNRVTFVSVVKACASLAVLERGKGIHASVRKNGFDSDISVGNALIDMYAKCGSMGDAWQVFDGMHERSTVSWTAMIAGYAQHGHGKEALALFEQMLQEGTKPNEVTFISVLSACSHAGLVDEAHQLFDSMSQEYGITPTLEHYACMVDLLTRLGHLDEAEDFIKKMPMQPVVTAWTALLAAYRKCGNAEPLGRHTFKHTLLRFEPKNASV